MLRDSIREVKEEHEAHDFSPIIANCFASLKSIRWSALHSAKASFPILFGFFASPKSTFVSFLFEKNARSPIVSSCSFVAKFFKQREYWKVSCPILCRLLGSSTLDKDRQLANALAPIVSICVAFPKSVTLSVLHL